MFCEQKTREKMIQDSEIATKNALNDLKTQINNANIHTDSLEVEVSTDSISIDDNLNNFNFDDSSDDDSIQEEIVLRKSGMKQKNHHKSKENSMIFMFSKYENAQKKNRTYKTKIVKLENRLVKLEEREHYKNLDLNNSKLQVAELQEKIKTLQMRLKSSKNDLLMASIFFISVYSMTMFTFLQSNFKLFDFLKL